MSATHCVQSGKKTIKTPITPIIKNGVVAMNVSTQILPPLSFYYLVSLHQHDVSFGQILVTLQG